MAFRSIPLTGSYAPAHALTGRCGSPALFLLDAGDPLQLDQGDGLALGAGTVEIPLTGSYAPARALRGSFVPAHALTGSYVPGESLTGG